MEQCHLEFYSKKLYVTQIFFWSLDFITVRNVDFIDLFEITKGITNDYKDNVHPPVHGKYYQNLMNILMNHYGHQEFKNSKFLKTF